MSEPLEASAECPELDSELSTTSPSKIESSHSGYTLQNKPASVTLGRKESLTEKGNEPDNLESTKDFYGVATAPTPQTHTGPQHSRSASRDRNRSSSRVSQTKFSVRSRPMSPLSHTSSSMNPARHGAAPMPTPKGFYSPKKPAAAMRLEQMERKEALRRAQKQEIEEEGTGSGPGSAGSATFVGTQSKYGPLPLPSIPSAISEGPTHRGSLQSIDPPFACQEETRYPPTPPVGRSLTEIGSYPDPDQEINSESSEDLVHRRQRQQNKYGDSEKPIPALPLHHQPSPTPNKVRRYKNFENPITRFCFNGRLMTGGDAWWSIILALVLLFGTSGVWIGTTGVWMCRNGSEYGLASGGGIAVTVVFLYLFGLTVSSFLAASLRDPGLLPRNLDRNPPTIRGETDSYEWPLDRSYAINDGSITVRWCETCRTYRPPRSSHCRLCDNCVDGIDHHCAYIHTCVGRRNYLSFLTLLITATIAAIYIVVFSAIQFMLICRHEEVSFVQALRGSPGAAVGFLLGCIVLPSMLFLLAYHIRLMIFNLTTVEQIRESASKNLLKATRRPVSNPFSADSLWTNALIASLGRPQFPSWIDASGWEKVDRRRPNPGVVSQSGQTATATVTGSGLRPGARTGHGHGR